MTTISGEVRNWALCQKRSLLIRMVASALLLMLPSVPAAQEDGGLVIMDWVDAGPFLDKHCPPPIVVKKKKLRQDGETPWSRFSIRASPSFAQRHHSQDCLSGLPDYAVTVDLTCEADLGAPKLRNCLPDQPVDENILTAARRLTQAYSIAPMPGARPASFTTTRISVVVDPRDRVDVTRDFSKPLLMPFELYFTRQLTAFDMEHLFPERAQRLEHSAKVVAICKVQATGFLICTDLAIQPAEYLEFTSFADAIEAKVRVSPTLVDGSPSVDRWVRFSAHFVS